MQAVPVVLGRPWACCIHFQVGQAHLSASGAVATMHCVQVDCSPVDVSVVAAFVARVVLFWLWMCG